MRKHLHLSFLFIGLLFLAGSLRAADSSDIHAAARRLLDECPMNHKVGNQGLQKPQIAIDDWLKEKENFLKKYPNASGMPLGDTTIGVALQQCADKANTNKTSTEVKDESSQKDRQFKDQLEKKLTGDRLKVFHQHGIPSSTESATTPDGIAFAKLWTYTRFYPNNNIPCVQNFHFKGDKLWKQDAHDCE